MAARLQGPQKNYHEAETRLLWTFDKDKETGTLVVADVGPEETRHSIR